MSRARPIPRAPASVPANATNPYLFIVGAARSGTTLLQRIVDGHPEIAVVNETYWLPRKFRPEDGLTTDGLVTGRLIAQLVGNPKFDRMGLSAEQLDQILAAESPIAYPDFVSRVFDRYAGARGKRLAGDKSPGYVRKIPQVHALWPAAKFVHLIRDGRNVCLSLLDWGKGARVAGQEGTWELDPVVSSALYWRRSVLMGQEARDGLGTERYHEVRYESLVAQTQEEAQALCDFLQVRFDGAMLRYHEGRTKPRGKSTKSRWLPPVTGLRNWGSEMTASSLERFEAAAGDVLESLGYTRAVPAPQAKTQEHVRRVKDLFETNAHKRGRRFPRGW